ncbi:universal stress protein [Dactylosporangium sp. CA-233914]|uniref:universal stress protein n=1 Tax=Dactylosporangium sp. CA-233914 TaxID=3239934 RepID=UPI003D8D82EB
MTMTPETTHVPYDRADGRIAVGVEPGPGGLAALSWATEEAVASGARMTICHARRDGDRGAAADLETLRLTQPDLVRRVEWCRKLLGGFNVTMELPLGELSSALLGLSEHADLLVVGGHPDGGRLHRSVPAQLAARAMCPVVVVRPVPDHDGAPFAGHVVVGVDGSPASAAAIEFGFRHARRRHLPVAAVHVDDRWPGDFWFDDRYLETHFAAEPAALELLAREIEPVAAGHPRVAVKRAVFGGNPVAALRHAATGAALLVVGRHGERRPALLRLGSVSRAFAEQADCVVAVVPPTVAAAEPGPSTLCAPAWDG